MGPAEDETRGEEQSEAGPGPLFITMDGRIVRGARRTVTRARSTGRSRTPPPESDIRLGRNEHGGNPWDNSREIRREQERRAVRRVAENDRAAVVRAADERGEGELPPPYRRSNLELEGWVERRDLLEVPPPVYDGELSLF